MAVNALLSKMYSVLHRMTFQPPYFLFHLKFHLQNKVNKPPVIKYWYRISAV